MKTNELISILRDYSNPNVLDYIDDAADTLEAQQKRIEELENELKDERYRHDRYVDYELAQSRELEELRAKRRWIPVTERLPEVGELVLACAEGEVAETWRESGENWATDPDCGITHWMPLPEPPKEA